MKQYLEIPLEIDYDQPVTMYNKLDGSNIRAEWNKKKGWTNFGSRKKIISSANLLAKAVDLIHRDYAEDLVEVFKREKFEEAVPFFEFLGPASFAGQHVSGDIHIVKLIDVSVHRKGILPPQKFKELFGHLSHAAVLYEGVLTPQIVEDVENGTFPGMSFEGVVCKGELISPGRPLMFKIKNKNWIARVREIYGHDEKLLKEIL